MDMKDTIASRVVALARQRSDLWNESLGQIRYKRLASLAGMAGPTIERMVDGSSAPTATTIEAVAIALGVPAESLVVTSDKARLLRDYDKLPPEGRQVLIDTAARLVRDMVPERTYGLFRRFDSDPQEAAQMRLGMDKTPKDRASSAVVPMRRAGVFEE